MNFPLSPHFSAVELFSKDMIREFGQSVTWFIDPRILPYLEFMRSRFGVTYLNNWYWGGPFDSRGYRAYYDHVGGIYSQHRAGRATDCTFKSATPDEVRQDIIDNWEFVYKPLGITTIESDVSWVHADMRYIPDQKELLIVKP